MRRHADGQVVHTRDVLRTAREVYALGNDELRVVRRYLLTADRAALASRDSAAVLLGAKLDSLVARTGDNPTQQARARALREAMRAFERDFTLPVARAADDAARAETVRRTRAGETSFDEVRARYGAFIAEEDRLFRIRAQRLRVIEVVALGLVLVELLFAVAVLLRFQRRLVGQARALAEQQEALEEQAAELEASSEDLVARAAELEAANRRLAEANTDIAGFSYTVAHDLRAPLRSIDGYSHILLEEYGPQLDEPARGYLARIRANAQRMGEMIDGLLTLARLRRGELRLESVDLAGTTREVAGELQRLEPARAVDVVVPDGLAAVGDRRLLRVVMQNLLTNAWKFTRERPRACIEVGRLERPAATAAAALGTDAASSVYFVRDDGVGFDMAHAHQLFGTFQRLHDGTGFEGTGIGLATVRRVIERHGGRVWAESAPGAGATFYFSLPDQRPTSWGPAPPDGGATAADA
jgi:signal transduction histidine kinase